MGLFRSLHPHPGAPRRRAGPGARAATPAERYGALLFNHDRLYESERDAGRLYGTFRHRLSPTASYYLGLDYQRRDAVRYPLGFSDDLADALRYGDIDDPVNATAARYVHATPDGYVQRASDGSFALGGAYGLFALPGEVAAQYQKAHTTTLQLTGRTEVTLGVHQVEFGGEYEQQNRRFFTITAGQLARFHADGHAESSAAGIPEGGVTRYDQLSFEAMRAAGGSSYTYYGYDFLGLNEVDDQDVDAFGEGTNRNVAPYQPIYYAGYVQEWTASSPQRRAGPPSMPCAPPRPSRSSTARTPAARSTSAGRRRRAIRSSTGSPGRSASGCGSASDRPPRTTRAPTLRTRAGARADSARVFRPSAGSAGGGGARRAAWPREGRRRGRSPARSGSWRIGEERVGERQRDTASRAGGSNNPRSSRARCRERWGSP